MMTRRILAPAEFTTLFFVRMQLGFLHPKQTQNINENSQNGTLR
jgi:hypothetical protein